MKKLIIMILTFVVLLQVGPVLAQTDILPLKAGSGGRVAEIVEGIGEGGKVWDKYKEAAYEEDLSLGDQFASGVMTWDTLLDYASYLVRFIGQMALLVGAFAIILIGYQKALEAFNVGKDSQISKVIKGILVITFAYFIIKLIYSAFIS